MSDIPVDRIGLARIEAEITKLNAETRKLLAEQTKLLAEGRKFRWDPLLVVAGAMIAGAFLRLPEILHAAGIGY